MERATHDWLMSSTLPDTGELSATLYVEISKPRHPGMLTDATVDKMPEEHPDSFTIELILAGLCGLLIVPFVYNIGFYRLLRERFLLWHATATACMFSHILISSGLINRFTELSVNTLTLFSVFTWSAGIVAAGMFILELVEPEHLDPRQKKIARWLGPWTFVWTVFYIVADGSLRPLAATLFYTSFLPVLAFFVWVMVVAARRRSRSIRFVIAACFPMMIVGLLRIITTMGLIGVPLELTLAQHLAIAFEVIITSLAVADRFLAIKHQRDKALAQSRSLAHKVEHDALTGLLNRWAISERFHDLHAQGFDTMAVIDLDHFKLVNDTYGHAVGDEVLRSVADALQSDDNTLAVRMGGEEFLLLMRGGNSAERAERRRQAITTRIASDVPGLERPVTASMGLVEQQVDASMDANFIMLYSHCDRLLYEAKRTGRNRTMSEKVTRFGTRAEIKFKAAG